VGNLKTIVVVVVVVVVGTGNTLVNRMLYKSE